MPPKKQPSQPQPVPQQKPQPKQQQKTQAASKPKSKNTAAAPQQTQEIPDHEIKKQSSMSATMALEAAKKAYELRQAAYGAGDPNAREEILAKAINKEIEAESFGKAAKYTRSGAFQGLAAGAGLGVQPGVTLGKLTGALVGGLLSSVGAVLGGGIGSAYGAMSGPFWDLGQIASQGVRSIVGDFPNWEATSSQKNALEKMVMGAQQTKKPDQDELEEMRQDDGGADEQDYNQFTQNLSAWIPSMPSMPSMPNMPSMSSIPGFGGREKPAASRTTAANKPSRSEQQPKKASTTSGQAEQSASTAKSRVTSKAQGPPQKSTTQPAQSEQKKPATKPKPPTKPEEADSKVPDQTAETPVKRRPKKLETRSTRASTGAKADTNTDNVSQSQAPTPKRKPPKLQPRQKPATASRA